MKVKYAIILLILSGFCSIVKGEPNVWTVNPDPASGADFDDLQDAIDAATDGDILYVAGAVEIYSEYQNIYIDKRLLIYGPGYFLTENGASIGTNKLQARVYSLDIREGGDGTLISGMTINELRAGEMDSLYLKNNMFRGHSYINIFLVDHLVVTQNYFAVDQHMFFEECSYIVFTANIVLAELVFQDSKATGSGIVTHNYFADSVRIETGAIELSYNVFGDHSYLEIWGTSTTSNFNLYDRGMALSGFVLGSHDITNSDIENVYGDDFTDYYMPIDNRFILPADSIAKDVAGSDVDAGPFGGDEPYQLSGVPNVPRIKSLSAPNFSSTDGGITIELSIDTGPEAAD